MTTTREALAGTAARQRLTEIGRLAAIATAGFVAINLRLDGLHRVITTDRPVDEATIPSPATIRGMMLGHNEVAADALWVSARVLRVTRSWAHSEQRYLQAYATSIEQVDPFFRTGYSWAGLVSIFHTKRITEEGVRNAITHLERGVQLFPDDGEMLYQLGFDYYFELRPFPLNAAQHEDARRRGAEYLRRSASVGFGPRWMALAATGALESAGLVDQAISQLGSMYLATDDPAERARIEADLRRLGDQRRGEDPYAAAMQSFDRDRRSNYFYVPPPAFLFDGPSVPGLRPAIHSGL